MLRVTTQMTGLAGAPYFSTQYFLGSTALEAESAADAVGAFWAAVDNYITNGLTIKVADEVDAMDAPTGVIQDTFTVTGPQTISAGNAPLPKATQGLVRLRTSDFIAGRRVQGRIFIPALANDAQLLGVPSGPFVTDVQAAITALRAAVAPTNALAVWHRPTTSGGSDGSDHAVSTTSVWNQFAVLRSRRD